MEFLEKVKLCKLPGLVCGLFKVAKNRGATHHLPLNSFEEPFLQIAAERLLSQGHYDYKRKLGCSFHNQVICYPDE